MILVDANLLVYAHVLDMPESRRSRDWLDARINGNSRVGLPWSSLIAFLRLVTNPRVFPRAESMDEAWDQVSRWLDHPNVWTPIPGEQHRPLLHALLPHARGRANLIPDAHLAALAIEHGLTLCSADGDFARFPGLSWMNPLA